jgi:YjjG family noncanonical pyrimidine nucleotidase
VSRRTISSAASSRIARSSSPLPIRAVLFDLDHTLFDTDRAERIALRRALRRFDVPFSPAILEAYRTINAELWADYQRGRVTTRVLQRERFRRLLAHLGLRTSGADPLAACYRDHMATRGDLLPGCRGTLRRLARRFPLATVTNGTDRVQRARLRAAQIDGFFAHIVTSESAGYAKPDPRIVYVALDALGIAARDALLVGDDPESDGRAAARAGVRFCWIDHGRRLRPGVRRPRVRVRRLPELLPLVDPAAASLG